MLKSYCICAGIICVIAVVIATDCPYTEISFVKKQGSCSDYENGDVSHSTAGVNDRYKINYFADNYLPFCTTTICGDGRHHLFCTISGTYAGDCIAGDAIENFKKIYAGRVDSVAIHYSTLSSIPALVNELVEDFTSENRTIRLYEDGKHKGESIDIHSKKGQCVNLPTEWQMRVSSYGSKEQARFYTDENCTGHSVVACRDFTAVGFWSDADNLWGLLCSTDRINDNTRSYKFE